MEPLNQYEIQELLTAMGMGMMPVPIGSLWSNHDGTDMYVVLHHANIDSPQGPMPTVVVQALPAGDAWVFSIDAFMSGNWQNVGFVWDRGHNNG